MIQAKQRRKMKRLSRTVVGMALVVGAIAAIQAAPASAAACQHHSGSHQYSVCVNGEALGSPTEVARAPIAVHLKSGTVAKLEGPSTLFDGGEAPLTCSGWTSEGWLESGEGRATVNLTSGHLTNCEYTLKFIAEKCSVPSSIGWQTSPAGVGTGGVLEFNAPVEFTTIRVQSKPGKSCPTAMTSSLFSLQDWYRDTVSGRELEAGSHELVGAAKESHIYIAGTFNTIAATQVTELSGSDKGDSFSIAES
jgi:hypothetical protein